MKAHIALLTNVFEGEVKNEHMTIKFYDNANPADLLEDLAALNARWLPLDLSQQAVKLFPLNFRSWGGERITHIGFAQDKDSITSLVKLPHITLGANLGEEELFEFIQGYKDRNWDNGLVCGELHIGTKIDGSMRYFTEEEFMTEFNYD